MKRAKAKIARMSSDKSRGQRLREARIRAGYETQAKLADAIPVRHPTYNRYEKKGDLPKRAILKRIAELLGVTPAWIEHGPQVPTQKQTKKKSIPAVEAYLANELGSDTAEDVADKLREFPYDQFFAGRAVGVKDVHRVRDFLEYCVSLRRKR